MDDITETVYRAPRTISEQIADACGQMILDGKLKAGQKVVEQSLAEQFSVSRGPVREALRILQSRRLVDIVPRKGAHVLPISLGTIEDLFNTRIALACLAARTVAERSESNKFLELIRDKVAVADRLSHDDAVDPLDFAFAANRAVHMITLGSGNQLVVQIMEELTAQTVWTTIWKTPLDYVTRETRRNRAEQLKAVLKNIEMGQGDAAELNLRLALEESRDTALKTLEGRFPVAT